VSFYFSGIKADSSAPVSHRDIIETYTVSTVFCCDRWETVVSDDLSGKSELVWYGDDETTRADARCEHDRWSNIVREGKFGFQQ